MSNNDINFEIPKTLKAIMTSDETYFSLTEFGWVHKQLLRLYYRERSLGLTEIRLTHLEQQFVSRYSLSRFDDLSFKRKLRSCVTFALLQSLQQLTSNYT
jgi:hypothetical protein